MSLVSVDELFDAVSDTDYDSHSGYDGVADMDDGLWRKSLLLQRDLAREGKAAIPGLLKGLDDPFSGSRSLDQVSRDPPIRGCH